LVIAFTAETCPDGLILSLEISEKLYSCMDVSGIVTLIRIANWSGFTKSRLEFWLPKLKRNKIRDEENQAALMADGWSVLVVWESELKNVASSLVKYGHS
jgi:hypothetical protein